MARIKTLEQRIQEGIARRQFTFTNDPDCYLCCGWCEGRLLVDYFQFSRSEMTRRIVQFTKDHANCEPSLKAKPKDMMLTPKEKAAK